MATAGHPAAEGMGCDCGSCGIADSAIGGDGYQMELLLIRHGLSVGNAEGRLQGQFDSPLADQGRRQARALARRLVREKWSVSTVYSSDLSRASETAEILAASLDVAITLDARLREYDFGALNGVIWREVQVLHPEIWQAHQRGAMWAPIPREEGADAFFHRLAAALVDIQARHEAEDAIAVVTHGGSLGMMMVHFLGMEIRRPTPFWFDNASLSVVEFGARGAILSRLNDTCHLDGAQR